MIFKNYGYFLKTVETGSVSKAAEEVFVSQPSISKYIKRLEDNLEIELFDRSSSPLRLTYAGERYLEYIKQYLSLEAQFKKEFSEIKAQSRGKIVIGVSQWTASMLIPHVLPLFWAKYPDIEIVLREGPVALLLSLIESNKIDFCLTNFPVSYKELSYEMVMLEPILLAINSNSPLLAKLKLASQFDINNIAHFDFTQVSEELFILPQKQNLSVQIMSIFNRYSFRPKKIFETESISTALGMVSAGVGVTFVPFRGVCFQQPANLSFFTVGEPVVIWSFGVAYKANTCLSQHSKFFIDHLKDCLGKYSNEATYLSNSKDYGLYYQ